MTYTVSSGTLNPTQLNSPSTRAPYRGGVGLIRRFSTNISLCLRNGARQGHSYYGRVIGNRMRSIEWRYYRWPSVSPNRPKRHHFRCFAMPFIFPYPGRQALQIWGQVYHTMFQPVGDKPPLKRAWSGSCDQLQNFTPNEISSERLKLASLNFVCLQAISSVSHRMSDHS